MSRCPNENFEVTIRLVVSDVDGTLVRKDKSLSPQVIAAVHRLRDAGVPFTLISARPISGMIPLIKPLRIDIPLAAVNGGIVFRPDGVVLSACHVGADVVRGIFDIVGEAPVDRWVFADMRWYATSDTGTHVEHERVASAQTPVLRDDFTDLYDRVDKLTIVSDDAALLKDLADKAKKAFGTKATIGQSQTYYLDVTGVTANKGDGVATLAQMLGIDLADVAVFGDMNNDVPMFDRAGFSVAMGQAPDAVKAKADKVSSSNEEDGVAHAIDAFILPKVVT